jgi:hypothetical protein
MVLTGVSLKALLLISSLSHAIRRWSASALSAKLCFRCFWLSGGAGVAESLSLSLEKLVQDCAYFISRCSKPRNGEFQTKGWRTSGTFHGHYGLLLWGAEQQRSAKKAIFPLVSSPYVVVVSQETNIEIAWIWQMVLLHNPVKYARYPFQSEV